MGGRFHERLKEFLAAILSRPVKEAARFPGDTRSWSRQRTMPLPDIIQCTLGKKGLTTVMEVRQYFQDAGKEEQTVSKQDYLQQRRK
ncbi:MAG: hypothetical protein LBP81_08665, partial [Treponema sp.]|nr:hypothetical protein [Treponema sp.]